MERVRRIRNAFGAPRGRLTVAPHVPTPKNALELGKRFATCGSESVVRIWEKNESWSCVAVLDGIHTRAIRALDWSADGKFLACASFDATVSIWESHPPEEWEQVGLLEGHENEVKCVAWHPLGKWIATCGRDKTIWIWEVMGVYDYECVDVKHAHSQDVKMVKWHPSGEFLVSASYDNSIKVWKEDAEEEWQCLQTVEGHTSTVWGVDFMPDGKQMVSCSDDRVVKLWGVEECRLTFLLSLTGYHDRTIFSLHVSNNRLLATGCGDDGIRVFCVTEGESVTTEMVCHVPKAHSSDVNCVRWNPRFSHLLLSAGDDGCVRIWNFTTTDS